MAIKSSIKLNMKELERRQFKADERCRAIQEGYDGLVYVCSRDFRIEYMNSRMEKLIGRDAVGELCYKALHDRDEVCPWCVNELIFAGERGIWELKSPRDNRWYEVTNFPVLNADGTMSKQAMIRDITDRKEMQAELIRVKRKVAVLEKRIEAMLPGEE